MPWNETPITFDCDGHRLVGIAAVPAELRCGTGVLIVVGGPQYRAGSHRQFTLLARQLAERGIASFRFDYRGMGDSEGEMRNFEAIDADIRAALDAFMQQVPQLADVAVWGLCDAASAALYMAPAEPRVSQLILLNPWVHSPASAARARLKHYYLGRLMQKSFWLKLLRGKLSLRASLGGVAESARTAAGTQADAAGAAPADPRHGSAGYVERMLRGLERFRGQVRIILSGNDLTAREFEDLLRQDKRWHRACGRPHVAMVRLPEANHTFSSAPWRDQVAQWTAQFVDKS